MKPNAASNSTAKIRADQTALRLNTSQRLASAAAVPPAKARNETACAACSMPPTAAPVVSETSWITIAQSTTVAIVDEDRRDIVRRPAGHLATRDGRLDTVIAVELPPEERADLDEGLRLADRRGGDGAVRIGPRHVRLDQLDERKERRVRPPRRDVGPGDHRRVPPGRGGVDGGRGRRRGSSGRR